LAGKSHNGKPARKQFLKKVGPMGGNMKRIASFSGSLMLLSLLALPASAQTGSSSQPTNAQGQSGSSLGDYARQAKKDGAPAKARPKVFDNDNLPKEDKLSVVGAAAPADANAKTTDDKDAAGKADDDQTKRQSEWKGWQDKLSAQKNAIDLSSRELDVLQKEYQLRAAAMYGDAGNRMRNAAEWDKEDADFKQKIADKQKAVDDAKQKLDDMQEEARKAGVPAAMREP
jgi:hypothetical protein